MVADPVGGNTYFKNFMNGFAEAVKIVVYQTCQERKTCSDWRTYTNRASKSILNLTNRYFATINLDSEDLTKFY